MPSEGDGWREYDYSHIWHEKYGKVHRPMYQVKFSNGTNSFWSLSLVDSGAGALMINSEFAEILGINLQLCTEIEIGGVGSAKGYTCDISIEIEEFGIQEKVSVIFSDNLPFSALLGQDDFFSWFDVRFEKGNGKFYLRKA